MTYHCQSVVLRSKTTICSPDSVLCSIYNILDASGVKLKKAITRDNIEKRK